MAASRIATTDTLPAAAALLLLQLLLLLLATLSIIPPSVYKCTGQLRFQPTQLATPYDVKPILHTDYVSRFGKTLPETGADFRSIWRIGYGIVFLPRPHTTLVTSG